MSHIFKEILFINSVVLILSTQSFGEMEIPKSEGPFEVKMVVFIIDIDEIDASEQNFTANVFYRATWVDKRLSEKIEKTTVMDVKEVWTPWLQVVNQQKIWPTLPEVVTVSKDGTVLYRQRVWGQFSQPLDLRNFPFDEQNFVIQFVSLGGYKEDEIKLIQDKDLPSAISDRLSQADWIIVDWEAKSKAYSPLGKTIAQGFNISFKAKRKTGYYIIKIITPLVLIVMMSWAVFWIDPKDEGTQIGVAVTSMLTLIAYRFATDALLPKVSYLTRLDYFILGSTILIFSGLIEVLITTALAKKDKLSLARTVDKFTRWIMPILFLTLIVKAFVFIS